VTVRFGSLQSAAIDEFGDDAHQALVAVLFRMRGRWLDFDLEQPIGLLTRVTPVGGKQWMANSFCAADARHPFCHPLQLQQWRR
jgi:hypothetical protein